MQLRKRQIFWTLGSPSGSAIDSPSSAIANLYGRFASLIMICVCAHANKVVKSMHGKIVFGLDSKLSFSATPAVGEIATG